MGYHDYSDDIHITILLNNEACVHTKITTCSLPVKQSGRNLRHVFSFISSCYASLFMYDIPVLSDQYFN